MTIDPLTISTKALHGYLLGAITPRPIALASTIDAHGNVNLSPFSFFNCFGTNPPILIFAPSFRVRDKSSKHTHENVLEVPEVVIHIVSFSMMQQMSLSSADYPRGVDEFVKAGFTARKSERIKPPIIEEAPVAFECSVQQVLPTGDEGGSGILIICRILLMHLKQHVLDDAGNVDPYMLDAVGRLGGDRYVRVNGDAVLTVPKPSVPGIGLDQLPREIRNSRVLTGNDLAMLAGVSTIPEQTGSARPPGDLDDVHRRAKHRLDSGDIDGAWKILLA
jgi:flavin reductase (DIM6/NTAB) family NADH-FMN oxidoreductase RutF